MEGEQSQVSYILQTFVILYIYVENNLAYDSSIYTSTGGHSSTCDAWPEARPPAIQERLHWVCTCLQFGISCSLLVYHTDQWSLQSEWFFLCRENTTKLMQTVIVSMKEETG